MKRLVLVLSALILFFFNVPLGFAQVASNDDIETSPADITPVTDLPLVDSELPTQTDQIEDTQKLEDPNPEMIIEVRTIQPDQPATIEQTQQVETDQPRTDPQTPTVYDVFISEVQTSTGEFIELYNPHNQEVSLDGWSLVYRGSGSSERNVKTFSATDVIRPKSFLVLTNNLTVSNLPAGVPQLSFTTSLPDNAYLKLKRQDSTISDLVGWGNATEYYGQLAPSPIADNSLQRCFTEGQLQEFEPRNNFNEMKQYSEISPGLGVACLVEEPNPEPERYQPIIVTELLPNVAGVDSGKEFIELFNPSEEPVNLGGYKLAAGPNLDKTFTFSDRLIQPKQYLAIYDSESKLTLLNTSSRVSITAPDGSEVFSESEAYSSPLDDHAWALINNSWTYTKKPTPGAANELVIAYEDEVGGKGSGIAALSPCPAGKYRHPLTNRCRNIESDASVLASCDADEYRNPETNRCRKIATATSTLTACKAGEYRSPLTNRCRKIQSASSSLTPCQPGYERNPDTNRCRKTSSANDTNKGVLAEPAAINSSSLSFRIVVGLAALGLAYGAYQWRRELLELAGKLKGRVIRSGNN